MIESDLRARQKLVGKLPITDELLRGSLLGRTIDTRRMPEMRAWRRASRVCLTVTYRGRTRRSGTARASGRVRRWLSNYQDLKEAIETVCELNRSCPEWAASKRRRSSMIEMRRAQLSWRRLIAEEVTSSRDWMKHADAVLADGDIVAVVYGALAGRRTKSRSHGRRGVPAEVVLRLLILKHIRNWSYQVLEREVRANLNVPRLPRVGAGKTPDAKTMGRWGGGGTRSGQTDYQGL
jgi:hypothetical protein